MVLMRDVETSCRLHVICLYPLFKNMVYDLFYFIITHYVLYSRIFSCTMRLSYISYNNLPF